MRVINYFKKDTIIPATRMDQFKPLDIIIKTGKNQYHNYTTVHYTVTKSNQHDGTKPSFETDVKKDARVPITLSDDDIAILQSQGVAVENPQFLDLNFPVADLISYLTDHVIFDKEHIEMFDKKTIHVVTSAIHVKSYVQKTEESIGKRFLFWSKTESSQSEFSISANNENSYPMIAFNCLKFKIKRNGRLVLKN